MKHHLIIKTSFTFLGSFFLYSIIIAQSLSSADIISKSIKYHDPQGLLTSESLVFSLKEERPNGSDRMTTLNINIPAELIQIISDRDEHKIISTWHQGNTSFNLDGSNDISEENIKKYRLNEKRLGFMKDYYRYLWHLPTTLNDPETLIAPMAEMVDFFDQKLLEIKVTYEKEVGVDIWYFYFHPSTYALSGYRFYHDESANDGEYILLSGETKMGSLRLPQRRVWMTHKEDKLLGADVLLSITKI